MSIKTIISFLILTLFFVSCGWKATEQDIKQMEETRSSALSAEEESAKKKKELEQVKNDLENEKREKTKAEEELKRLEEELKKFEEESKVKPTTKKKKN